MTRFLRKCLHCGHALSGRFGRAVRAMQGCCEGRARSAHQTVKASLSTQKTDDDMFWFLAMMALMMNNIMHRPAAQQPVRAIDAFEINA